MLVDEDNGKQTEVDIAQYLNIEFYKWKDRLVAVEEQTFEEDQSLSVLDDWVRSLNFSMNQSYALVEKTDSEVVASQDIDSATILGRITFLIQAGQNHSKTPTFCVLGSIERRDIQPRRNCPRSTQ